MKMSKKVSQKLSISKKRSTSDTVESPSKRVKTDEKQRTTPSQPDVPSNANVKHSQPCKLKRKGSVTKAETFSDESRPASYLPQLRKNVNFVKSCLRNKELWCKLSDEEKEYCKKAKEKMKKDRDRQRSEKSKEQNKIKQNKKDCFLFGQTEKPAISK